MAVLGTVSCTINTKHDNNLVNNEFQQSKILKYEHKCNKMQ